MKKVLSIAALVMVSGTQSWGVTPEGIFANGLQESAGNKKGMIVRKGTIKALIDNVLLLNREWVKDVITLTPETKIEQTVSDIREAIPLLEDVYVFDVFSIEDWIDSLERPGNILVGVLYLKTYPEKLTSSIRNQLTEILKQNLNPVLNEQIKSLI